MNDKYFDKQKQEKALQWLDERWPQDKRYCEICSQRDWQLAEDLVIPLSFSGANLNLGGRVYPHVLIMCKNCGNAKCFNAVIMKIEGAA